MAQVRQVQQVPVHQEPGGRWQRQVQPDGIVLGRGRRFVHTQPPAVGLHNENSRRTADRSEVCMAREVRSRRRRRRRRRPTAPAHVRNRTDTPGNGRRVPHKR